VDFPNWSLRNQEVEVMENGFKILIDRNPEYHIGADIRIGLYRDGRLYIAEPIRLVFNEHKPGQRIRPTLELDDNSVSFLSALEEALRDHKGITEGYVNGELKATKEHLKDMQALVFKTKKV
jgi:hypothetical protein